MKNKVVAVVFGLPGSGKTTFARKLQKEMGCMWFNADKVRATVNSDLQFTPTDRLTQARRLAQIISLALEYSEDLFAIADFVSPTHQTRWEFENSLQYPGFYLPAERQLAFGEVYKQRSPSIYKIFMNTISPVDSRFADTSFMFQDPEAGSVDMTINKFPENAKAEEELVLAIQYGILKHFTIENFRAPLVFDGKDVRSA